MYPSIRFQPTHQTLRFSSPRETERLFTDPTVKREQSGNRKSNNYSRLVLNQAVNLLSPPGSLEEIRWSSSDPWVGRVRKVILVTTFRGQVEPYSTAATTRERYEMTSPASGVWQWQP